MQGTKQKHYSALTVYFFCEIMAIPVTGSRRNLRRYYMMGFPQELPCTDYIPTTEFQTERTRQFPFCRTFVKFGILYTANLACVTAKTRIYSLNSVSCCTPSNDPIWTKMKQRCRTIDTEALHFNSRSVFLVFRTVLQPSQNSNPSPKN